MRSGLFNFKNVKGRIKKKPNYCQNLQHYYFRSAMLPPSCAFVLRNVHLCRVSLKGQSSRHLNNSQDRLRFSPLQSLWWRPFLVLLSPIVMNGCSALTLTWNTFFFYCSRVLSIDPYKVSQYFQSKSFLMVDSTNMVFCCFSVTHSQMHTIHMCMYSLWLCNMVYPLFSMLQLVLCLCFVWLVKDALT